MKTLPKHIAGGPEVSDLAYRIVVRALDGADDATPSVVAEDLGVDESEVLRAYAELKQAEVIVDD